MTCYRKQFKNIKKWIVMEKNIKYEQFDTLNINIMYD